MFVIDQSIQHWSYLLIFSRERKLCLLQRMVAYERVNCIWSIPRIVKLGRLWIIAHSHNLLLQIYFLWKPVDSYQFEVINAKKGVFFSNCAYNQSFFFFLKSERELEDTDTLIKQIWLPHPLSLFSNSQQGHALTWLIITLVSATLALLVGTAT